MAAMSGKDRSCWPPRETWSGSGWPCCTEPTRCIWRAPALACDPLPETFTDEELPEAVRFAHDRGVRVHCTVNTMPRNGEVRTAAPPSGALERGREWTRSDRGGPGCFYRLAQRYAPRCQRHISTQASVCNYAMRPGLVRPGGPARVILARELSLDEIREIRAKTPPELELECFVHGAMCVSYSGRCVLSNYMTGRDSSRGACAQPCRYQYALMEEKRPGEYFPVFEDEKGSLHPQLPGPVHDRPPGRAVRRRTLQPEDRGPGQVRLLCRRGHRRLPPLSGRRGGGKTAADPVWRGEVEQVSHRHYSTGFFYGQPGQYTGTFPLHPGVAGGRSGARSAPRTAVRCSPFGTSFAGSAMSWRSWGRTLRAVFAYRPGDVWPRTERPESDRSPGPPR
jgi:hypothetical protein